MSKSKRIIDSKSTKNVVVFSKHDTVGSIDALQDTFLDECFVDNGLIEMIKDCNDHRRIILGRTGSGKTALLNKFNNSVDNSIWLNLEHVSFNYVSNSAIIKYWIEQGVNMNTFFKWLWRHIFSVALLRFRYKNQINSRSFFGFMDSWFGRDTRKRIAVEYLKKWDESFWKETDFNVKEIVSDLERNIQGQISIDGVSLGSSRKESSHVKEEPSKVVQKVVDGSQIRDLGNVIELLKDIFDENNGYYIIIDGLDEDWVDSSVRYKMIRALVETIKDFSSVRGVKIIASMRVDLFESVIVDSSKYGAGFQSEKYRGMELLMSWDYVSLRRLIDLRISLLFNRKYTKDSVSIDDVFDGSISSYPLFDWMTQRTLKRPRDIIDFVNKCIEGSGGEAKIRKSIVERTFPIYSFHRLESIFDEWSSLYPSLRLSIKILESVEKDFVIRDADFSKFDQVAINVVSNEQFSACEFSRIFSQYLDNTKDDIRLKGYCESLYFFYKMGLVLLKVNPQFPYFEYGQDGQSLALSQINESTHVRVQAMFCPALSIR